MNSQRIRVGIVGFGLAARVFHLPLIQVLPEFDICGVVTSQTSLLQQHLPHAAHYPSLQLLLRAGVDLVIICTPNDSHASLALEALDAGVHVVVEKPLVCSYEDAKMLTAAAAAKKRILAPFHNRRWDNGFLTVKQLIVDGTIGEPRLYIARFDRARGKVNPERWREKSTAGGGVLFDLGSHLLDQAVSLFGLPRKVSGELAIQRADAEVEDYFHISLDYPNLKVHLQASSFVHSEYPHLELHGTKGSYVKYGLDPQEAQAREGLRADDNRWGLESEEDYGKLTTHDETRVRTTVLKSQRGNYLEFYRLLACSIKEGSPPPISLDENMQVIRILEQLREEFFQMRPVN